MTWLAQSNVSALSSWMGPNRHNQGSAEFSSWRNVQRLTHWSVRIRLSHFRAFKVKTKYRKVKYNDINFPPSSTLSHAGFSWASHWRPGTDLRTPRFKLDHTCIRAPGDAWTFLRLGGLRTNSYTELRLPETSECEQLWINIPKHSTVTSTPGQKLALGRTQDC